MNKESNWYLNAKEISKGSCVIPTTSVEQVCELTDYLEWLLPFECYNKNAIVAEAKRIIDALGIVYLNIGYFSFLPSIGRTARIDVMPYEKAPVGSRVLMWKDLKTPLYNPDERDDAQLTGNSKLQLENLLKAYG
ncbi:hypothetical protein [Vibrio crassostreae]|uniref:hypothetical protein n=1 Tax=Vibrio crassostreae TaxID=246167 RepID=UPI001B302C70|nr:hypothetical protein [Vibrio crassostreae]